MKHIKPCTLHCILEKSMLMANDVPEVIGQVNENENRFKIVISAKNHEEADKLFYGLSEGGQIEMLIGESPWGSYLGMFRCKNGIEWRVYFNSRYKDKTTPN
jgi:PhnB protein